MLTLTPPADLVPRLVDALSHLSGPDAAALAADLGRGGAISARRELLEDTVRVAIDEAGDRVAQQSTRLLRGEASPGDLRARLAALSGLLDLLDLLESLDS